MRTVLTFLVVVILLTAIELLPMALLCWGKR